MYLKFDKEVTLSEDIEKLLTSDTEEHKVYEMDVDPSKIKEIEEVIKHYNLKKCI